MNRMDILEAMFKTIKESTDWGVSEERYGLFIDGVMAMTEAMLDKEKEMHKKMIEKLRHSGMVGVINDSKSNAEFSE